MPYKIAVLVGSLRSGSINRRLAAALEGLAQGKLTFEYASLGDLPLYNDDLWQDGRTPDFASALGVFGTRLFLYGKRGARPGRKMGHLAAIGDTPADALDRVQRAASRL